MNSIQSMVSITTVVFPLSAGWKQVMLPSSLIDVTARLSSDVKLDVFFMLAIDKMTICFSLCFSSSAESFIL